MTTDLEYCPDCGQEGQPDLGYVEFGCGTVYRIEKYPTGLGLYGPAKGRTPECYETEISNLNGRIRFLTEDKVAWLRRETRLTARVKKLEAVAEAAEYLNTGLFLTLWPPCTDRYWWKDALTTLQDALAALLEEPDE